MSVRVISRNGMFKILAPGKVICSHLNLQRNLEVFFIIYLFRSRRALILHKGRPSNSIIPPAQTRGQRRTARGPLEVMSAKNLLYMGACLVSSE